MEKTPEILAYEVEVRAAMDIGLNTSIVPFSFGDNPGIGDELAALVVNGPKRATAGWVVESEADGEPIPKVGDVWIVTNGKEVPVCAIRTVEVRTGPLVSVDEAFAFDEGEGDRTVDWWMKAHLDYFERRSVEMGVPFDPETSEIIFERFELVHVRGQ